ncbi:MAG: amidohydrolase family protein [Candidatus Marinimicrobia bacterium]|nr:amidohydrolase family protein [Candidatus Neomarinimicrobiota bacterium]MBL7011120.1 amidohydrolase family protein [Candidatus Neomarinimicrobiota bacterium]MBL7030127.1 amidohydrolase family protein [Candidatus Neomarinimicrobiota bacterium]
MKRIMQLSFIIAVAVITVFAQDKPKSILPGPDRSEGEGPFNRLVIRGATVIDGSGAPPMGPVDIVIEGNKITAVQSVGYPGVPINEKRRPKPGDNEIDAHGAYVMPGFVDMHAHAGDPQKAPETEYVYKLWLAHGVTTVRGVPIGSMEFSLTEKERSAKNEITAPRIWAYQFPGQGNDWKGGPINSPETARQWVKYAARKGVDGIKLRAFDPEIMEAILDEAKKHNLGSTAHLAQTGVARMNTIDAARLGLGTQTHYYGLFESMYENHDIQPWPVDMNYSDEQHRFGQVARQWSLVNPNGEKWESLKKELLALDMTMDPTMNIYAAGRDVMKARNADWHSIYTLPSQWEYYMPSRRAHGSYWFNWTTADEIAWKKFYQVWMQFLNEYKNAGGRVTTGSDSGFIYKLYGFGYIEELELLQEAGFHPLEVLRAATLHGAETLHKPLGTPVNFGMVKAGYLADLVIVDENPLANFKVLYGTGAVKINENNEVVRVGGVKTTIKDGIVYDAKQLLADVENMVKQAKRRDGDLKKY